MATVTVVGEYDDWHVRRAFQLPLPGVDRAPADNVESIDIDPGPLGMTIIELSGFDHQGAGVVDGGSCTDKPRNVEVSSFTEPITS